MAKNLALVLHPSLDLKIEERSVPSIKSDEVLLRMHSTGICGTDLHMWSHGSAGLMNITEPMVLGHEASGTVIKVGQDVKHLKEGDRVCVEPLMPCSHCSYCTRGQYNHCLNLAIAGYPLDGMCTTFFKHPARSVHKLPEKVSLEEGAMVEPLTVATYSCKRAGIEAGQNVLICGAGPVGILTMMCAKAMGVNKVCISDIRQQRLDLARELGADHVIMVSDKKELKEQVHEILGDLADVTIDCCGSSQSVPAALLATRRTGNLTIVGMGADTANISLNDVVSREVDIRGVFAFRHCFPLALSLLNSGAIKLRPLVTHKFELVDAEKAFRTASNTDSGAMKVLIQLPQ